MRAPPHFLATLSCVLLPHTALSDTTIRSTNKYLYSANVGWINAEADVTNGLVVAEHLLSGYAYGANIGWINFGDGSPDNGIAYANDSSSDFGVNHDGLGTLTGFAYSANTGWVTFEQTHGQPKLSLSTGQFSGFAYSANLGWINLTTLTTNSLACPDSDADGIADHWELQHFGNLTTANTSTNNDFDYQSDAQEYLANTDPNDPDSFLSILIINADPAGDEVSYQISAGPGRFLTVESSTSLQPLGWTTLTTYQPLPSSTVFEDDQSVEASTRRFFRLVATKPLQN